MVVTAVVEEEEEEGAEGAKNLFWLPSMDPY